MHDTSIRTVGAESILATNKVLKNTYLLLSMTLFFSAVMAGVSMSFQVSYGVSLMSSIGAMLLIWFVIPRTAHSASGLIWVFVMTGLLGFGLGPVLNYYLHMANGAQVVMTALGGTAAIFLGLSGYALTSRKDFSFMGGMLFVGIMVAFLAGIAAAVFSLPGLALGVSSMFVLLASGLILFETSRIIHGGETNYILATVSLYVSIYNLFTSLLHLLGAMSNND